MDDTLLGTRKGLFTVRGGEIAPVSFLGAPVTAVLSRQEQDVKCQTQVEMAGLQQSRNVRLAGGPAGRYP